MMISLFVLFLVASGYLFPKLWLMLLGSKYEYLSPFVWIALGIAGLRLISETFYRMLVAGGKTERQYLVVVGGIASQLLVFCLLPMQNLSDIYFFVAASTATEIAIYLALYLRSVHTLSKEASSHV
jgi:hypothetical protein